MNKQAQQAIYAAKHWKQWGREAAYLYALDRIGRDNMRLYFLARTLEAAQQTATGSN